MNTIKDIDISKKKVFIRVDFNVPLDSKQQITDDAGIEAVLPTLKYALSRDACIILASHLGRPKGQVKMEFSLQPVARRLGKTLGLEVMMAPDCIGGDVAALADGMAGGQVLMLENLRFHEEETQNDSELEKPWLLSVTFISTMLLPYPIVPMHRWYPSRNMRPFRQQGCFSKRNSIFLKKP